MHNRRLTFLMIFCLLTASFLVRANTQELTQQLKVVGQGEMSWMFIDLYQATLYSETGQYKALEYPQALNILYMKNISQSQLLSATQKEWEKLSLNHSQHSEWITELAQIWPDIKKGDQLLFTVEKNGQGYFYHNQRLLGGIKNKQFSEDFLAIWLAPNSSEPNLRKQLLGE